RGGGSLPSTQCGNAKVQGDAAGPCGHGGPPLESGRAMPDADQCILQTVLDLGFSQTEPEQHSPELWREPLGPLAERSPVAGSRLQEIRVGRQPSIGSVIVLVADSHAPYGTPAEPRPAPCSVGDSWVVAGEEPSLGISWLPAASAPVCRPRVRWLRCCTPSCLSSPSWDSCSTSSMIDCALRACAGSGPRVARGDPSGKAAPTASRA